MLDGQYSGIIQVGRAGQLNLLQQHLSAMQRDGYFYTPVPMGYVTNQSERRVYYNNLTLVHKRGNIVQSNDYYPLVPMGFGLTWENPKDDLHTYHASLREGKELQRNEWSSGGLDMLDFSQRDHYVAARMYNPLIGRWHNPDPMNQFDSPYNAMGNNPVINIDPDGMWSLPWGGIMGSVGSIISNMTTTHIVSPRDMSISTEYSFGHGFGEALQVAGAGLAFWDGEKIRDEGQHKSGQEALNQVGNWYRAEDNTIQYGVGIKNELDIKATEQFLGSSYIAGTTEFRSDGSIFFKDETAAYGYMWNNSLRNKNETFAVISNSGVLVMPEYLNTKYVYPSFSIESDPGTSFGYNYSQTKDKIILSKGAESFEVLATIHTHPFKLGLNKDPLNLGLSEYDKAFALNVTPGRPVLVMDFANRIHGYARNKNGAVNFDFSNRNRDNLIKGDFKLIKTFKKWKM